MEKILRSELEEQFARTDLHNVRSKAVVQLKSWQEKMFILIERTYATRLNEIDSTILNRNEKIGETLENLNTDDRSTLQRLRHEIDELNSNIIIKETIPEDFRRLLEQTIHIQEDNDDDDDDFVMINDEKYHTVSPSILLSDRESRASKVFHSEPVQHVLTVGLTQALSHAGTMAAASTPAIAAAAMAKTFLFGTACGMGTLAYGMGRVAMGTSKRVWSLWN
jgi:hypothetical protein